MPPTIRVSGLENNAGNPHDMSLFSAAAGIVKTEPVRATTGASVEETFVLELVVVVDTVVVVGLVVDDLEVGLLVVVVAFFVGRGFVGLSRYDVVM